MSPRLHTLLMTTTALLALTPKPGVAGPDGAVVAGGAATVQGQGTQSVIVNQTSNRAIINWNTFNIATGGSTQFNQPNSSSVALNRVTGGLGPSSIDGTLTANGKVFLINRDGMLFGPNAKINTAGFVATTHDIKNEDFMAGNYRFGIPGRPDASIINQGQITATNGGFAALVAPGVRNTGTITATLGTVSLASGNMFTLDMYGDKLIQLGVGDEIASKVIDVATGQPLTSLVSNEGRLRANGGRVELTAVAARQVVDSVINNKGVIEANSIGSRNGMIVLGAATGASKPARAPQQTVKVGGTLSAAGKRKNTTGGTIVVTGENIQVANATIDASGQSGGGKVLIGGDWAGGHPTLGLFDNASAKLENVPIPTASTLSVDAATTIDASARNSGNGGKVILWSDSLTTFAGTILARGGEAAGNGGFVETSGHQQLVFDGSVDTRTPNGLAGTLLVDPTDAYVDVPGGPTRPTGATVITNIQVQNQLALGNFVLTTNAANQPSQNGDIFVASNVSWANSNTLTLSAHRNIQINDNVIISNTAGGNLILRADSQGSGTGGITFQQFTFGSRVDWTNSTGKVSFFYNPTGGYANPVDFTPTGQGGGTRGVTTSVPNQFTAYMLVNSVTNLQNINTNLAGTYALGKDINANTLTASIPGNFSGIFDGNGGLGVNYAISHLPVGLFSTIDGAGVVRNLNLTDVAINVPGGGIIGALTGVNHGTIANVAAGGSVSGGNNSVLGGLVGDNFGSITNSSAVGSLSAGTTSVVGGLAAVNEAGAAVSGSFAGGTISSAAVAAGGLVGSSSGSITDSYAATVVSGGPSSALGGLVGVLGGGSITTSYATGPVIGGTPGIVGGLVGSANGGSSVTNSFWDVQTSGRTTSAGGAGLTTAALQAGLQSGWSASVWGIVPGVSYPFLKWQFPNGTPQVVSGIAFNDRGVTPVAGATIGAMLNGNPLFSALTGGTASSGANGYYYLLFAPGTLSSPGQFGVGDLAPAPGINPGATFVNNAVGSIAHLDIYGSYLRDISSAGSLSAVSAGRLIAIGSNPGIQAAVNALPNHQIDATGPSFSIDQNINTNNQTVVLSTSGALTQTPGAVITATNLALLGTGGSYTLTNNNQVGTLAANTGAVSFKNNIGLNIGTVAGTNGVTTSGAFTLNDNAFVISANAPVSVGGTFTLAGGNWVQNTAALPAFNAADFQISGGASFLRVTGGNGSAATPYSIFDVYGLQGIASVGLGNNYVLANDINATGTSGWNAGAGFKTIGTTFTGTFNGQNHAIDHLTIASASSPTGLFGFIGTGATVSNLKLTNVSITGTGNLMFLGGLAGENDGTVSNVSVSGAISGGTQSGIIAGGLVGNNRGTITGSSSSATVSVGSATTSSSINAAGGLVGTNLKTITLSSATGNVSGGGNSFVGGLVGQNGLFNFGTGTITSSFATGAVTATGLNSAAGGLAGTNANGSTITDSQATGAVAATANGTNTSTLIVAGGLVGTNSGTITSTTTPSAAASCATGASFSCASGNVSVGTLGNAGGLVGGNDGTIAKSFATGAVTGGPGLPDLGQFSLRTTLGGLAATNHGTITDSFATGTVGTPGVAYLTAGGLVADSNGTILRSFATGNVRTGDHSEAGGLVGTNGPCDVCNNGNTGDGHSNAGLIQDSHANGAVSVGMASIAGGLMGDGNGTITNSFATGSVTGGGSNILGGLAGGSDATITGATASGAVTSLGDQSILGGLVGFNAASISGSSASGPVQGTSDSYLGGLVGFNIGLVTGSHTEKTASVTGLGTGNTLGGLAGSNVGRIEQSQAAGNVITGQSSTVGGLVGSNDTLVGDFSGFTIPSSTTFPVGTITNSSASGAVAGGDGSSVGGLAGANGGTITASTASGTVSGGTAATVGGLVGTNSGHSGASPLAGFAADCKDALCGALNAASFSTGPGTITGSSASGAVSGGDQSILGGLAGINIGTIGGSHATGNVTGGFATGGLVGINIAGTITGSDAAGTVTGGAGAAGSEFFGFGSGVGGLVGFNLAGTINTSHATGNVSGGLGSFVGGFVGFNFGGNFGFGEAQSISGSYATGTVTGGANSIAGGFFGVNLFGAIDHSHATGAVSGGPGSTVGGFGGLNMGTVDVAFASGKTSGGDNSFVGGFVGVNFAVVDPSITFPTGAITQSYALGATTGGNNSFVAGFAAINVGSLDQTYAAGLVTAGPGSTTGGLVASNTFNYTLPPSIVALDPPGTTTNSYWDRQTTGQNASAGGTPFNTAQLATGLPTGFDPNAWASNSGQYPSLIALGSADTTPGTPVLPPVTPPELPVTPQQPPQTEVPAAVLQQQVAQQFKTETVVAAVTTAEVVSTQPIVQQQQQQQQAQQNAAPGPAAQNAQLGPQPIRLNVGEGRYFFLPPPGETRLVQNEIVLQLPCDIPAPTLGTVARQLSLNVLNSQCIGQTGTAVYRMQIGAGQTLASVIRALASHRVVAAAQANYTYALAQDGAAETAGDAGQYILDKLKLNDIHRVVKGANVSIAVIDSEIDATHPDLEGVIVNRFDATGDEDKPHAHGTGMAGAIGSHRRLMGIAPSARLYAIRAFSSKASTAESTTFNILKGLDWAVNNGVRIVNMSFAGPKDPSLERALKAAYDKGIILIAAAGNAGPKSPALYPAADKSVIAVTATDIDDKLFAGANRGNHVAIAAPGVDILVPAPEGTYQMTTGTSVATAHISGIVALLLERNPRLTPDEVRKILAASAKRLGPKNEFGAGLVDPTKALELAAPKSAAAPAPVVQ